MRFKNVVKFLVAKIFKINLYECFLRVFANANASRKKFK